MAAEFDKDIEGGGAKRVGDWRPALQGQRLGKFVRENHVETDEARLGTTAYATRPRGLLLKSNKTPTATPINFN